MEAFNFELRLVDAVSATAKKSTDAVKKLDDAAQKAQRNLDAGFAKQWEKIGFASMRAAKRQQDAFAGSWAKIGMAAMREGKRMDEMREKMSVLGGIKEGVGLGKITSGAFLGSMLAEGAMKIGEGLIEAAKKVVDLITDGVKEAFTAAANEEKLRLNYRLLLGEKEGERALQVAEQIAKMSRFTGTQVATLMRPLYMSGFSQASAKQAFGTASDVGAMGGDVQGMIDMFAHIKTRGGVTRKMLMGALGNVGTTIPDFFKDLGKQIGVSAKTAEKMASAGGLIDPQLLMNMITGAVNRRTGGAAGAGGQQESNLLSSRLDKLKNLPEAYFKQLVNNPQYQATSDALGQLLQKLDPDTPEGKRIMASIDAMFARITGLLTDFASPEGIDKLVDGIQQAVKALESAVDLMTSLVGLMKDAAGVGMKLAHPIDALTGGGQTDFGGFLSAVQQGRVDTQSREFRSSFLQMTPAQRQQTVRAMNVNNQNNMTFNIPGGEPEKVKQAVIDAHHAVTNHMERMAQHGG